MMVDEFDGDEYELRLVVDAAQTMPFLTDKRVVIARQVSRFNADDLVAAAGLPRQSARLVRSRPRRRRHGTSVEEALRRRQGIGHDPQHVARVETNVRGSPIRCERPGCRWTAAATAQLATWLGEDAGRLDGILATLKSTYGAGEQLSFAQIEPFIGEAGGVPPWDLTDAIMAGDTTKALSLLGRMIHAGGRHPLQVMSILHNHYAGHRQARRRRRTQRRPSGRGDRAEGLPGEEGAAELQQAGWCEHQTGHRLDRPSRPGSARCQGARTRTGHGSPGRPAQQAALNVTRSSAAPV